MSASKERVCLPVAHIQPFLKQEVILETDSPGEMLGWGRVWLVRRKGTGCGLRGYEQSATGLWGLQRNQTAWKEQWPEENALPMLQRLKVKFPVEPAQVPAVPPTDMTAELTPGRHGPHPSESGELGGNPS